MEWSGLFSLRMMFLRFISFDSRIAFHVCVCITLLSNIYT